MPLPAPSRAGLADAVCANRVRQRSKRSVKRRRPEVRGAIPPPAVGSREPFAGAVMSTVRRNRKCAAWADA